MRNFSPLLITLLLLVVIISVSCVPRRTVSAQTCAPAYLNNCPNVQIQSQIGQVQDTFYNQYLTEVEQGQTINVSVALNVNSFACNLCYFSVGFAVGNAPNFNSSASGFTNASNASPATPLETVSGTYDVVLTFVVPANLSNIVTHYWQVDVVEMSPSASGSSSQNIIGTTSGNIAVISPAQYDYWSSEQNLTETETSYENVFGQTFTGCCFQSFGTIFSSQDGYAYAGVANQLDQGNIAYTQAQKEYAQGSFTQASSEMNSANSHEQQAIQLYEADSNALMTNNPNQNGTYTYLVSIGVVLLGIGAMIAGIGVLLRRRV